jgi:hypothetical protein
MKTRQMKTIGRLIEMKRRAAEVAEMAHASAHAKTVAAENARLEADRRLQAGLDAVDDIGLASDLEDRDMKIRGLRRSVEQTERQFVIARAEESGAREAMTDARVELRRFETWLEKTEAERAAELQRVARIADDEVAARKLRAG